MDEWLQNIYLSTCLHVHSCQLWNHYSHSGALSFYVADVKIKQSVECGLISQWGDTSTFEVRDPDRCAPFSVWPLVSKWRQTYVFVHLYNSLKVGDFSSIFLYKSEDERHNILSQVVLKLLWSIKGTFLWRMPLFFFYLSVAHLSALLLCNHSLCSWSLHGFRCKFKRRGGGVKEGTDDVCDTVWIWPSDLEKISRIAVDMLL